jgi:hypothetical protein
MAIGTYGIIRPSDVSPDDVDIFYHYVSGLTSTAPVTLKKLTSASILTPVYHNSQTTTDAVAPGVEILGGLYNLQLQSSDFSEYGYYTIHIRPKQIRTLITDCGVLASLPSVRGLVIDLSNVSATDVAKFTPQGLVGYRIEYLDTHTSKKIPNSYTIVTSSFYCQPVASNLSSTTQKAIRYQYSDSATNLVFLTITPSSAPSNKPNTIPNIGVPNQKIILTNTFVNPTTIEIEMVEYDTSTLAYALYGNQTKAVNEGVYTIYDKNNQIYKQYNLYEINNTYGETLYEIRQEKTQIDQTLNFNTIISK